MNVSEIISSGVMQACPMLPSLVKETWDSFDLCIHWDFLKPAGVIIFLSLFSVSAAHILEPPYGRWGGWCVWARPPLLALHIQGDKVSRPGHTDTWPYTATEQRHAALWSRRGAQTTFLRWGGWHCLVRDNKCYKTKAWDLQWEMGNSVAVLMSPMAPDSRDHSDFYGLYGVYPAALLFKRRQTGIVSKRTQQKCSPA